MRQVNMGSLQKQLKKSIYSRYLMNNKTYGLKIKPGVEISGKLNAMSYVVVTITLLKPEHMCPREDYKEGKLSKVYDDETAGLIYDDILKNRQWHPGYPYDEMPTSEEMRDVCYAIEGYVFSQVKDIFNMVTVIVNVVFNTPEEIAPWKEEERAFKKWLKEVKGMTPGEWEDLARFRNREPDRKSGDWRMKEEKVTLE